MAIDLTCPNCGHRYTAPGFTNVTFKSNTINVLLPCPACRHAWDVTGGGDGTFSVVGRRLVKVADVLASKSREDLVQLQAELHQAKATGSSEAATAALRRAGLGEWLQNSDNRTEVWTFLALLVAVISLIVSLRQGDGGDSVDTPNLSPEQIVEIIRKTDAQHSTPTPRLSRNVVCPCGSGKKYKRCHGLPTIGD